MSMESPEVPAQPAEEEITPESEDSLEKTPEILDRVEMAKQEEAFLDRFKKKARAVLRVYMLATSLTNLTTPVPVSGAELHQGTEHHEMVNATRSEAVSKAEAELPEVKTAEDAEWYMKSNIDPLLRKFFFPTEGKFEVVYGIKVPVPDVSRDTALLHDALPMFDLLKSIHMKYPSAAADKRLDEMEGMIKKLEYNTSYGGRKSRAALFDQDDK